MQLIFVPDCRAFLNEKREMLRRIMAIREDKIYVVDQVVLLLFFLGVHCNRDIIQTNIYAISTLTEQIGTIPF